MDETLLFLFFVISVLVLGGMMQASAEGVTTTLVLEKDVKPIRVNDKVINGRLYNGTPVSNKGYLLKNDLYIGLKISYADSKGLKKELLLYDYDNYSVIMNTKKKITEICEVGTVWDNITERYNVVCNNVSWSQKSINQSTIVDGFLITNMIVTDMNDNYQLKTFVYRIGKDVYDVNVSYVTNARINNDVLIKDNTIIDMSDAIERKEVSISKEQFIIPTKNVMRNGDDILVDPFVATLPFNVPTLPNIIYIANHSNVTYKGETTVIFSNPTWLNRTLVPIYAKSGYSIRFDVGNVYPGSLTRKDIYFNLSSPIGISLKTIYNGTGILQAINGTDGNNPPLTINMNTEQSTTNTTILRNADGIYFANFPLGNQTFVGQRFILSINETKVYGINITWGGRTCNTPIPGMCMAGGDANLYLWNWTRGSYFWFANVTTPPMSGGTYNATYNAFYNQSSAYTDIVNLTGNIVLLVMADKMNNPTTSYTEVYTDFVNVEVNGSLVRCQWFYNHWYYNWIPLRNYTDNTNCFQNQGNNALIFNPRTSFEVGTILVEDLFMVNFSDINNVVQPAVQNNVPLNVGDYAIHINSIPYDALTIATIASQNNWDVCNYIEGSKSVGITCVCNMVIENNGVLNLTGQNLIMAYDDRWTRNIPYFNWDSTSTVQLGEKDTSGRGTKSSTLGFAAGYSYYTINQVGNLYVYGSTISILSSLADLGSTLTSAKTEIVDSNIVDVDNIYIYDTSSLNKKFDNVFGSLKDYASTWNHGAFAFNTVPENYSMLNVYLPQHRRIRVNNGIVNLYGTDGILAEFVIFIGLLRDRDPLSFYNYSENYTGNIGTYKNNVANKNTSYSREYSFYAEVYDANMNPLPNVTITFVNRYETYGSIKTLSNGSTINYYLPQLTAVSNYSPSVGEVYAHNDKFYNPYNISFNYSGLELTYKNVYIDKPIRWKVILQNITPTYINSSSNNNQLKKSYDWVR